MKSYKNAIGKFSLLVSSILLVFIIGELSMRIIGAINNINFTLYMKEFKNSDRLPQELYIVGDNTYKLNPNTQVLATTSDFSVIYKINSQGLRDKEYDFIKPKNKTRILAFGDSFTFGEGVKYGKRFTDIAERSLPNLEIINFGVPGYGLDQMLLKFAKEGVKYSPDYVIIFINRFITERFSTNIIKNNHVVLEAAVAKKTANSVSTAYINKNDTFFKKNLAMDKSFLLSFLNYKFSLLILKDKLKKYDQKVHAKLYAEYQETRNTDMGFVTARTALLIKKFNEICRKNKIKLIIININDYFTDMKFLKNINDNISYYDLSNNLGAESKKYKLSFVYDGHYNKKTHNFIGRKTADIIKMIIE